MTPRPARERVPIFDLSFVIQPPCQKKKTAENPQSYCPTSSFLLASRYADEVSGVFPIPKEAKASRVTHADSATSCFLHVAATIDRKQARVNTRENQEG